MTSRSCHLTIRNSRIRDCPLKYTSLFSRPTVCPATTTTPLPNFYATLGMYKRVHHDYYRFVTTPLPYDKASEFCAQEGAVLGEFLSVIVFSVRSETI